MEFTKNEKAFIVYALHKTLEKYVSDFNKSESDFSKKVCDLNVDKYLELICRFK